MPQILKSKYLSLVILLAILLLGIFLRTFKFYDHFDFAHDGDLYSWIVKDIAVNHHFRLIGQLTSSEGIFIGPLFYYALVPFFILSSMEPTGGMYLVLLISLATILSFFYIFKKLFNSQTGLIAAFLQTILLSRITHDRWVVPTNTTSLWEIWFFYCMMMTSRGNFAVFPLLGVLVSLIWHINFSEAPILLTIPFAILFSKKIPKVKDFLLGFVAFVITSIPLFLFEIKHNFLQSHSFINSFLIDQGGGHGVYKLLHVISEIDTNINGLFLFPYRGSFPSNLLLPILILLSGIVLMLKGYIKKKELLLIYIWLFSMVGFFALSSKIISEYYFSNLDTIFMALIILLVAALINISKFTKYLMVGLLLIFGVYSIYYMSVKSDYSLMGYKERKATAIFIKNDSLAKKYPCIGVNYIARTGDAVGFRYIFYLNNIKTSKDNSEVPVYNIVLPRSLTDDTNRLDFGNIGVIPPNESSYPNMNDSCSGANYNLVNPVFGYVE